MRNDDLGFTFRHSNGEYVIFHRGRKATTLRGRKAAKFASEITDMAFPEQQQLMARLTGNYNYGNERIARNHPRNRR